MVSSCIYVSENNKSDDAVTEQQAGIIPDDTLTVKGRVVIFYQSSQPEIQKLLRTHDSHINESLSDFEYYSGIVSDLLKRTDILTFNTTARYISVESNHGDVVYDRLSNQTVSGMIISSPRKRPDIINGVHNENEYLHAIENFYK
jgi:hypothetical protein